MVLWRTRRWKTKHRSLLWPFQIVNMTEQELKRVDVRVGLIGALRFMDGSPQGVRQLHHLHSQVGLVHTLLSIWSLNLTRILESLEIHEGDTLVPCAGKVLEWVSKAEGCFVPHLICNR